MHPLTHFLSGLIGKRHGQDLLWEDVTRLDEVRDAVRNDPRFARPRTSQNQERAIAVLHGFLLWRIKLSLQNRCHVSGSSVLLSLPQQRFEMSQFGMGVDAQDLLGIGHSDMGHTALLSHCESHDIGEILFPLGIMASDTP
jgi:hypothetical protein